jgi:hypothetical protein
LFAALLTDQGPKGNGQPANPDWPMQLAGAGTAKEKAPGSFAWQQNFREL